ncbi:MAG TPA: NAD(P)-dependent oxidoreductase [Thermomicrobiales bacterium]|nr:NAD(P)-dependent oxidoreductase [Thermomicrobiales bacterium]
MTTTRYTIACADGDEGYRDLIGQEMLDSLDAEGVRVNWHNGTPGDDDEWLRRVGDAEGLLLLWSLPDRVLRESPNLKAVSWVGSGVHTFVNVPLASALGIRVCNTPGYGNDAVAEHTLGLILALARGTVALDAEIRRGDWPRDDVRGVELAGKTLGVVGLGGIGTRVAQLGGLLGMRVLAWTREPTPERLALARATYASLEDLFAASDIVSLHLAPAPEATGIVSASLLRRMQPGAFLINTARAELVDGDALLNALRERRIGGAALDVFSSEPLPPDNPWRALPNVILTPHIGFRTPEASGRSVRMAVDNLARMFQGEPRHVVNLNELIRPRQ